MEQTVAMSTIGDTKTALLKILDDLAVNVPAQDIADRLRGIEAECARDDMRATFLEARGIALNRLGLANEALGDLTEAKDLLLRLGDRKAETSIHREIARVHAWRGEGREAALSLLSAIAAGDRGDGRPFVLTLIEAGRLNLEIGRLTEANVLLARSLASPGVVLDAPDRLRAEILLVQTFVALGRSHEAMSVLDKMNIAVASARIRHLMLLERARIAIGAKQIEAADSLIANARKAISNTDNGFEHVEICELEAQQAMARGSSMQALDLVRSVIAQVAEADLAGREIRARLFEAEVLESLDRSDEAATTRLVALRRAVDRDLVGYADTVRERLALRGRSAFAWVPGSTLSPRATDGQNRFVRRQPLGAGGFGAVSRAYDLETGEEVALKRLKLAGIYDTELRAKRLDAARVEAAAASRLQHPGIGKVFGLLVEADGDALLVRELVQGPTLREIMSTPLPPGVGLNLLAELAQALAAVHEAAIIHRDIKPENVVLRNGRHPVLIDFGASTIGAAAGAGYSAIYAPPEQIAGHVVEACADLYAFATMAFELLVGQCPVRAPGGVQALLFNGRFTRRLCRELTEAGAPPAVATMLARSLSFRPASRPKSARDLVSAFQMPI